MRFLEDGRVPTAPEHGEVLVARAKQGGACVLVVRCPEAVIPDTLLFMQERVRYLECSAFSSHFPLHYDYIKTMPLGEVIIHA